MAIFIEKLEKRIDDLEGRLALNSKNSSKPPSQDPHRKPANPRDKGANPPGGKKGHKGNSLMKVAEDQLAGVVDHKQPSTCDGCGKKLPMPTGCDIPGRQVLDLPPMAFEAIEHRVLSSACSCGKVHYGEFPPEVAAPVQYGSRIKAAAVLLNAEQMVPLARTANILKNISGL